jgi:hypothetical protein
MSRYKTSNLGAKISREKPTSPFCRPNIFAGFVKNVSMQRQGDQMSLQKIAQNVAPTHFVKIIKLRFLENKTQNMIFEHVLL